MEELLALLKGKVKLGKLELLGGKAKVSVIYDASGVDVELSLLVEANLLLDVVARLIPGQWDDLLINLVKAQLNK